MIAPKEKLKQRAGLAFAKFIRIFQSSVCTKRLVFAFNAYTVCTTAWIPMENTYISWKMYVLAAHFLLSMHTLYASEHGFFEKYIHFRKLYVQAFCNI